VTTFETIADAIAASPSAAQGLSTGLPELDQRAPLRPGHLAVLIGPSGVGKSRVTAHIVETLRSTHPASAMSVPDNGKTTTVDALHAAVAFHPPALLAVDPLCSLLAPRENGTTPHPTEFGDLATGLRELAGTHNLSVLACHRFSPARDSTTGRIVSTEPISPLIEAADLVMVVRVLPDPAWTGLEIIKNDIGDGVGLLRVPLGAS